MESEEEACEFLEHLAVALHSQGIKLCLPTLHKTLYDRCAHASGDDRVSQVVAAVYRHWEQKGSIIYHVVAHAFIAQNDADLFTVSQGAGGWHVPRF